MVTFEAILDARILDYLNIQEDLRMLFYGAVSATTRLRPKVEIICDFIDHFDTTGEWIDLKSALQDSVAFRNRCAHWYLDPVQSPDGLWRELILAGKVRVKYSESR